MCGKNGFAQKKQEARFTRKANRALALLYASGPGRELQERHVAKMRSARPTITSPHASAAPGQKRTSSTTPA